MSGNAINPKHYNRLNPQPKDVIRKWGLNFNLGSAVKYIARAGHKDDIVQDLKKAQEFIQFEIDAIEEERNRASMEKEIKKQDTICVSELLCNPDNQDVEGGFIKIVAPVGVNPEDIIKEVIDTLYGGK